MDDAERTALDAIVEETYVLSDEVEAALEEHAQFSFMLETRRKTDDLLRRYRQLVARLKDEKDRFAAERRYGRRVIDLQKLASRLPAAPKGKPADKPADTGFFARRAPKSSRPPVQPGLAPGEKLRDPKEVRVTGEIDAWCGRCGMMRTQVIAAVVARQPAQVVCQVCGSRSKYRDAPPRKKQATATRRQAPAAAPPSPQDVKRKEKNELLALLHNAENVRPYSPKERYKAGEIIEHPEHGRGVIENTLPRSLLVRFAGGLRPLKLG